MQVTHEVCSQCLRPFANKITVTISGKILCSRECGIRAVGLEKYLEAWEKECRERVRSLNRYQPKMLELIKNAK